MMEERLTMLAVLGAGGPRGVVMERGSRACGGDGALVRAGSKSNALRGEVSSGVGWCCCDGYGCDDDGTEGDDEARELPPAPGQAASSLAFSGLPAALELRLSCGTLVRAQAVGSSWSAASVECCPAACPRPAGVRTFSVTLAAPAPRCQVNQHDRDMD